MSTTIATLLDSEDKTRLLLRQNCIVLIFFHNKKKNKLQASNNNPNCPCFSSWKSAVNSLVFFGLDLVSQLRISQYQAKVYLQLSPEFTFDVLFVFVKIIKTHWYWFLLVLMTQLSQMTRKHA